MISMPVKSGQIVFNPSKPLPQNKSASFQSPPNTHQYVNNTLTNDQEKLDKLISTSKTLLQVSSYFPFDLFPDEIVVDNDNVAIITREFFSTEQIYNIPLEEIEDVTISTIPFFATLIITDKRYKDTPVRVKYLPKDEAYKAQRLIRGLITAKKQGVDLGKLNKDDLLQKAEELGKIIKK